MDSKIVEVLEILENKKKEADRFVIKYSQRKSKDLEEYYKGASWALDFTIKHLKDST